MSSTEMGNAGAGMGTDSVYVSTPVCKTPKGRSAPEGETLTLETVPHGEGPGMTQNDSLECPAISNNY